MVLLTKNVGKDDIIKELNAALARKEPLTNSGQATVLQLLTREAADEEKRLVEKELQRWKTSAQEKSEALKEKDKLGASSLIHHLIHARLRSLRARTSIGAES